MHDFPIDFDVNYALNSIFSNKFYIISLKYKKYAISVKKMRMYKVIYRCKFWRFYG